MGKLTNKLKGILYPDPATPAQDDPPAWQSRLQDAKYVSISGVTSEFLYLDLRVLFPLKNTVFESAIGNGAYVQINGIGAVRFPCLMIFSGDDHDKQANQCIQALLEQGEGTLYHPIFGPANVVPVGEIEYASELVSAANQTSILVELFETTGILIGDLPPFESILDTLNENSASAFADKIDVSDIADQASLQNVVTGKVGEIKTVLKRVTSGVENAQSSLDDSAESINSSIDVLIGDPLTLASQVQSLVLTPSRIAQSLKSKLSAYANLARQIFLGVAEPNGYDFQAENKFHNDKLVATSCISAIAVSTQEAEYQTKSEYIDSAILMIDLLKEFIDWSDDSYTAISADTVQTSDTGDGYQDLVDLVRSASSDLIARSFSALTEIKITTQEERSAYDLCYELYGTAKNDKLWFLANTNNFSGDEIFIVPAFREIVYYVSI